MASLGVLIGYVLFMEKRWVVLDLVQAAVSLIFIIVIFHQLLPYLFFVRTRGEWLARWVVSTARTDLSRVAGDFNPELRTFRGFIDAGTCREAVGTYVRGRGRADRAGQEEGILEESDRDLIQSVVEFGDKTVREVMTPRPEIVAVPVIRPRLTN